MARWLRLGAWGWGATVGLLAISGCRAEEAPAPRQAAGAAASVAMVVDHTCTDPQDQQIPMQALDRARQLKVLFGHQSVGFDVIRTLETMARNNPRYRMGLQHMIEPWWFQRNTGLGEFFLSTNGQPNAKVDAFVQKVRGGCGELVNVAMMKFCYADIIERTDEAAAFNYWKGRYEELERAHPRVRFVWWTVPVVQSSRLGDKRTRINTAIRDYCRQSGRPLLDIADIESHRPDGSHFVQNGAEMLVPEYGRDQGGHLNEQGASRVGRAYWWLLCRLSGWAGPD
ncbi:MAG: SGNH/GDSL hydrolase family protein [Fimbriimonadaceae bacterium]|nr:SGNH/GDSL hydrolase family protein [Fimbriimonadaceae bacterium]